PLENFMADVKSPSRLQRRAPASIQIAPATRWNVVIPLLSPLALSPISENPEADGGGTVEEEAGKNPAAAEKKWQHPAAPFSCETATLLPFV
ncbi:hypothetical protein M569_06911, partial [Genlisea aurea]